jgi:capsular exopolysaccharide synthesis family protein
MIAGEDSTASLLNDLGLSEMAMSLTSSDDLQNKIWLATSRPVMEDTIWRLQLRDESGNLYLSDDVADAGLLATLLGKPSVEVTQVSGTDVLLITAVAGDPETARLLGDTLALVYIQRATDASRAEIAGAQQFIQDQLVLVTDELDRAFAEIAEAQRESEIIDVESEVRAAVSRLSDLLSEQHQVASLMQETRAKIEAAKVFRGRQTATGVAASSMTENPVIGRMRTQLSDLRAQRQALLLDNHTTEAPEVKDLTHRITSAQGELTSALAEMVVVDPTVAELEANLAGLRERSREVGRGITATTEAFSSYPDKMRRLSRLELAASAAEGVYRSLQDQRFTIGIAEAMTMSDVRVVSNARTPAEASSPKTLINLIAAIVLGMLLGSGSALALEYVDDSIKAPEDVRNAWDLPQLGIIPRYRVGTAPALSTLSPSDPLAEAHRLVRNGVRFASLDKPIATLGVTSSIPGEGKSTLSMNLALSYAADGVRVLLIDADLRKPVQHKAFKELVSSPGLVEVLTRQVAPMDAVQSTSVPRLSVLAAGALPPNPGKLIESLRMRQTLLELGREFDMLVIDTPPVLAVSDPLVMAHQIDGLVIVVEAGRATKRMLAEVRDRFEAADLVPTGLVLNKVRAAANPYGNYAKAYAPLPKASGGGAA